MIAPLKTILWILGFGLIFLIFACDEKPQASKEPVPSVISGKIFTQPLVQEKKDEIDPKNSEILSVKNSSQVLEPIRQETEHYDTQGKIDPFESLIQDKQTEQPLVDEQPKRILTPLEKIGLDQIRLVAVVIMEKMQIAMVEEASGKGYEVGIGTYIGKNQGKVSAIKDSSIVITEMVRDFKGKLKERVQEIKLHKIENEE